MLPCAKHYFKHIKCVNSLTEILQQLFGIFDIIIINIIPSYRNWGTEIFSNLLKWQSQVVQLQGNFLNL